MLGARADDAEELSPLARSALQEAGNILSSAYLNALSEFMGMMILPSPPSLAIDMSAAIVTAAYLQLPPERDVVLCVESEFTMQEVGERLRGFFLLLPDAPSLDAILRAVRVA